LKDELVCTAKESADAVAAGLLVEATGSVQKSKAGV